MPGGLDWCENRDGVAHMNGGQQPGQAGVIDRLRDDCVGRFGGRIFTACADAPNETTDPVGSNLDLHKWTIYFKVMLPLWLAVLCLTNALFSLSLHSWPSF